MDCGSGTAKNSCGFPLHYLACNYLGYVCSDSMMALDKEVSRAEVSNKVWVHLWLFEGVCLTHVILTPGARGREGPNGSCCPTSGESDGIRGI